MTVDVGGPIRGTVGRWLLRFEAGGQIIRLVFLGVTAASTGVTALYQAGLSSFVAPLLLAGAAGVVGFAFGYVELGLYARKNRENADRGQNFAKPAQKIDDEMLAKALVAGMKERELSEDERAVIEGELDRAYRQNRSGIRHE